MPTKDKDDKPEKSKPEPEKAKPAKPAKDDVFVPRAARRAAEAAAAAEAERRETAAELEAERVADEEDQNAYDARYPERTEEERAAYRQQALDQATADARAKYKLDEPAKTTSA